MNADRMGITIKRIEFLTVDFAVEPNFVISLFSDRNSRQRSIDGFWRESKVLHIILHIYSLRRLAIEHFSHPIRITNSI